MNENEHNRWYLAIIILISLILHLIIGWLLLYLPEPSPKHQSTNEQPLTPAPTKQQSPPEEPHSNEQKPATVFFDFDDVATTKDSVSSGVLQETTKELQATIPTTEIPEQLADHQSSSPEETDDTDTQEQVVTQENDTINTSQQQEPIPSIPHLEQLLTQPVQQLSAPDVQQIATPKKRKHKQPSSSINLADITKGFITRLQTDTPQQQQERIARRRYQDKALALLAQAAQANKVFARCKDDLAGIEDTTLVIIIARNGALIDTYLQPSSNSFMLDQALIRSVRQVGLFPPIPQHIESDPLIIKVHIEKPSEPKAWQRSIPLVHIV